MLAVSFDPCPFALLLAPSRYGDEQHLEEALDRIFRIGKQGGLPRRLAPLLKGLREVVEDGAYTLVLEFESKLTPEQWEERQPKIQSFFGPGKMHRMHRIDPSRRHLIACPVAAHPALACIPDFVGGCRVLGLLASHKICSLYCS